MAGLAPALVGELTRAQPLLGALVSVRCVGLPPREAHPRIDAAFSVIADVHRLMSFHEPGSDVSRLNARAARGPVAVDALTYAVLERALEIARASDGWFDISVGDRLVALGTLPPQDDACEPDFGASWRDIELLGDHRVRFHRPLWIDLGGIAKGYAVDRAIEAASDDPAISWCVNAGGDLRVTGPGTERIVLDVPWREDQVPLVDLENASLASSASISMSHLDGRSRATVEEAVFASVVAAECVVADALTKVVIAGGADAANCLEALGATAFMHRPDAGWTTLGRQP